MVWLRSFGKAVFLAIAFGIAIAPTPYLFPFPLFLIIAYGYQSAEWVKGTLGSRSIGSFLKLRKDSCREGLSAIAVLFFSFAIFAIAGFILFIGGITAIAVIANFMPGSGAGSQSTPAYDMGYALGRTVYSEEVSPLTETFWMIAWTAVATALYRYEEWAQQRKRSRKLKKLGRSAIPSPGKPKIKPAPADPVDLELNKMRADSGLIKMKKKFPKKD